MDFHRVCIRLTTTHSFVKYIQFQKYTNSFPKFVIHVDFRNIFKRETHCREIQTMNTIYTFKTLLSFLLSK